MMDEDLLETDFEKIRAVERKFSYFLLAIDGATIAYVLTLLENKTLSWSMIPLGIALISWIVSFYCGFYRHINEISIFNMKFEIEYGSDRDFFNKDEFEKKASETATSFINKSKIQFYSLLWGYLAFIMWYLIEMIERTWGFFW